MTPDERRDHILELSDELDAIMLVDRVGVCEAMPCDGPDDPHGAAYPRSRAFKGAPLAPPIVMLSHEPGQSVQAYLVALHELGHIAGGFQGGMLNREAVAWRWALKQSGEDLTAEEWARIARDLRSYASCRRCKPDTGFDRLLRQAERLARTLQ